MTAGDSAPMDAAASPARAHPLSYADKPWPARLTEAQRAPVRPRPSVAHALDEAVRRAPDRAALVYFDGRLTYVEVDALSDGVAAHLARRGFRPGDRAVIMFQNTPHFVLALLGVWKAGGTAVPVNPMYKSGETAHILADAEVTAVICADRTWDGFLRGTAARVPSVRIVLTACERGLQSRDDPRVFHGGGRSGPAEGAEPPEDAKPSEGTQPAERTKPPEGADDLLRAARTPPDRGFTGARPHGDAFALISYTSGTSGTP